MLVHHFSSPSWQLREDFSEEKHFYRFNARLTNLYTPHYPQFNFRDTISGIGSHDCYPSFLPKEKAVGEEGCERQLRAGLS